MPRYSHLAVLLLACLVGSLFRPLDDGRRPGVRPSLDAPAALATGTAKIRTKSLSDGNGVVGLVIGYRAGLEPVRVVLLGDGPDSECAPRGVARCRLPARAPPLS